MKTKELVTLALLATILFVGQVSLAVLANIEVVSLLVIVYTLVFKRKVFFIIYIFALLEGLTYGFGIWWVNYLYVWSILAIIVMALQKYSSAVLWCIVSGGFGLVFGLLCAIPYFVVGGWASGVAYWIAGIPYDIIHAAGNAIIALVLFKPVHKILIKLTDRH